MGEKNWDEATAQAFITPRKKNWDFCLNKKRREKHQPKEPVGCFQMEVSSGWLSAAH